MDGKGPFSALVMGVVVLKDVLVILAFALNIQLVPAILGVASADASGAAAAAHLLEPLLSLVTSVSLGLVGGYLLSVTLELRVAPRLGQAARRMLHIRGGGGAGGGVTGAGAAGGGAGAPAGGGGAGGGGGGAGGGGGGSGGELNVRMALVLLAAAGIFEVARSLRAEPLLACVAAGMMATNRR
jgi:hypothetical protein